MRTARDWMMRLPAFAAAPAPGRRGRQTLYLLAALGIFGLALTTRFVLDPHLPPGFPYLTFFPAVIITGFVFGVRLGSLVAVLSGLASWYFFLPPFFSLDLSGVTLIALAFYIFIVVVDLGLIHLMTTAFRAEMQAKTETERLVEQQHVLANELDHRLKNIFATISAVISLSQRHAETPQQLGDKLREKLDAMGRSNLLLRGLAGSQEVTLHTVLHQAMEPFGAVETGRFVTCGPVVPVGGQALLALSLIFHELGTNAAKYGALSMPDGEIRVDWLTGSGEAGPVLTIEWTECGGPTPVTTAHSGFGSTLIRRVVTGLNGTWHVGFPAEGARILISVPLEAIGAPG